MLKSIHSFIAFPAHASVIPCFCLSVIHYFFLCVGFRRWGCFPRNSCGPISIGYGPKEENVQCFGCSGGCRRKNKIRCNCSTRTIKGQGKFLPIHRLACVPGKAVCTHCVYLNSLVWHQPNGLHPVFLKFTTEIMSDRHEHFDWHHCVISSVM